LHVTTSKLRKLDTSGLIPRRAYRLVLSARLLGPGDASVGVRFRDAKNGSFRTFRQAITSTSLQPYQLDFTAPAYVGNAELFIEPHRATLELTGLSLRMRAPLPATVPVASWAGSYVPDGYGLVFNDEFNGTELDRQKWFTRFIYDSETQDHLNKENQRYRDDGNHRVNGGVLALTAKRLKLSQPSGANYESGMIRSDFTVTYGFFEARVKMPRGLGAWPAFWLNSDVSETGRLSWPPEIDIFEFVNNGREDKPNQIHISTTNPPGVKPQFLYTHPDFRTTIKDYFAPFAFDQGWHTIGAEWTPTDVTMFVDGLKIVSTTFQWKYADGSPAGPAHILLNLAIGDAWAGRHGIDDSAFPQALSVDWVRVYQKT
jgi:beta-glucanase (GH16 family)